MANQADIILIGASTRAAAGSARRAGWTPWCADLFADADLQRIATVRKVPIEAYPQGLIDALADAPQAPVLFTGGLENHPDLIARIDRPLWGNPPEVLRAIRTPERWTHCLGARGLPCPALADQASGTGRWLLKPRRSGGGLGIDRYAGKSFDRRTHFLQERIDGLPCSALFLGHDDDALLLGVTQQLVGASWLNAVGFQYAGNLGPLPLDAGAESRWRNLGVELAKTFHLRGLFGVDAILRAGVPWPVEINPRYTASVEIFERSYRQALLPLHRAVFEQTPLPRLAAPAVPTIWGKAILYARQSFGFPADGPWLAEVDPPCADLPYAGEIIEQGHPVLTLFASAATLEECAEKLRENAEALARCLWG